VRADCDVVVVGAGLAGLAAAWSAAAAGARVVLCEREERVGGNVAQAQVHTLCGLYLAADDGDPVFANPGWPARFARELARAGAAGLPQRNGRVWVLPTSPARVVDVALARCRETPHLELRLGHALAGAAFDADGARLELASRDAARHELRCAALVDASGDAAAAHLAGAASPAAPETLRQRASYVVALAGVRDDAAEGSARVGLSHAIARAARSGELPAACESASLRRGAQGEHYLSLNLPRSGELSDDPLDARALNACSERARALAAQLVEHLAKTRPGFERARVASWPARVGIREARRLDGALTLAREDILEGRRRDDEVALSTWPIELWEDHRRARFEHPRAAAGIPLGALIARAVPRLAAAGRCISGTHEALGALRVLGTALATGEAAGVAAALAAARGCALAAIAPGEIRAYIRASSERE
jgi:2-polyprenyl-6-methoxyphenol hydroxylase-like FAD-dependent oxidoreductase